MSTANVQTLFAGVGTGITDVLTNGLPVIITIVAGLFGLMLVIRLAKRLIGGR